jgi:putative hydrolase of the HAD superfamily
MFDAAIARLGADRSEAVMLGDAWHADVTGALAAGVRPVWFNRFGAASPDSSVAELSALEPTADALSTLVGYSR